MALHNFRRQHVVLMMAVNMVLLMCGITVPFEFKVSMFSYAEIVSGARSLNCVGPGMASNLIPEAPEGCVLRRCSR
eukprot:1124239-Alexandrium_andersonii.AAC.1